MSNYTKGPWHIGEHSPCGTEEYYFDIYATCKNITTIVVDGDIVNKADAALIASAPDMLEALEALTVAYPIKTAELDKNIGEDILIISALEAIAKAKGGAE